MALNGEPSTSMSLPESLSMTLTFECMTFKIPEVLFWPHMLY